MQTVPSLVLTAAALAGAAYMLRPAAAAGQGFRPGGDTETAGALLSILPDGRAGVPCPLVHTSVKADISGPLARVTVEQQFRNPLDQKIEAVYTFPLSSDAAVDEMTMLVGDRTVRGKIKPKEEARAIYEAARNAGHLAGLLDQERPNIFSQAIANILPGESIRVVIKYVENVKYEDGLYQFSFPMVVGPRYNPKGTPNTAAINPPVTAKGTRAGHDISVEVALDAGVPLNFVRSLTHDVDVQKTGATTAKIALRNKSELPNKDFVLQYDVSGAKIADAVMTHHDARGGFFSMILQPPARVTQEEITPKELVFVLDTSGSMNGFPIEKAKETMRMAIDGLHAHDTFNLITFSGDTHILFPRPVYATPENLAAAKLFLESRHGSGGTEMMKAIRAALDPSDSEDHIRVVCFMTDGYVGNDLEIIGEVKKHPNARVFSFGIGSSVNHFLLDQMAREGRGEVEYVGLEDDGSAAARRFYQRVNAPLLTDLRLEWNGVNVSEVFPAQLPDLFSAKPVIVSGRYGAPGKGTLRLRGKQAGRDFVRDIPVTLPAAEPEHGVVATLWARRKVDALMSSNWTGMQSGNPGPDVKNAITQLGVDFGLMTQFTSFVAVEESIRTEGGQPVRIETPVEMPAGVSYEGIYGNERKDIVAFAAPRAVGGIFGHGAVNQVAPVPMAPPPSSRTKSYEGDRLERDRTQQLASAASVSEVEKASGYRAELRKIDPSLASVSSGKVQVKIALSDSSPEALARLKEAGFMLKQVSARFVIGEVDAARIPNLARLAFVEYITKP